MWWLDGTHLPIINREEESFYHFFMCGSDGTEPRWETSRRPRAIIPIVSMLRDEFFQLLHQELFVEGLNRIEGDKTLAFVVRSSHTIDGISEILFGLAVLPGTLYGSYPIRGGITGSPEACMLLRAFATLSECDVRPEHPTLLPTWEWLTRDRQRWIDAESDPVAHVKAREEFLAATAEERARKLLSYSLTSEQLDELERHKFFRVAGTDGHTYAIFADRSHGNVARVENGAPSYVYCHVPKIKIPLSDQALAQKLLIETSTQTFIEEANATAIEPLPEVIAPEVRQQHPFLDMIVQLREAATNAQTAAA